MTLAADYLVVGAGAVGMAFADTLLSESDATIAIVDEDTRPGGHWNHAYPFVRLHQPSAGYGVVSRPLGSNRIDDDGLNRGMYELASGVEIAAYFDGLMRDRFIPSGRVRYFPLCRFEDGTVTSVVSGRTIEVRAGKIVDGSLNHTEIPSRRRPGYTVAPGSICIPPNDLPRHLGPGVEYVVVGAGKTGMDVACWLLDNGADPDAIRWIVPRDSFVLDRTHFQPGRAFLEAFLRSGADQVEAIARATSIADLFERLEALGELRRVDPDVIPTAYHCATLSDEELRQLRRIRRVVRLGRVTAIGEDSIALERGSIPTGPHVVHIDCSARGLPPLPDLPVFDGNRINLLWVRQCQPVFSAALIAWVEAHYADDGDKNRLCTPIPSPQVPLDWLRMIRLDLGNRRLWAAEPRLSAWLDGARLNPFSPLVRQLGPADQAENAHRARYALHVDAAVRRAAELLAQAD